jgi:uncharacterized Tic20 family protein
MLNLPRQAKIYAALCHLSGVMWLVGIYLMFSLLIDGAIVAINILLPGLTWLLTRKIHDFVDRAGREVVNAQLSVLLYAACATFVTAIACGMKSNMYTTSPIGLMVGMLMLFLVPLSTMVYSLVTFAAMVQALRGNVFHYPLIVRFIPSPR